MKTQFESKANGGGIRTYGVVKLPRDDQNPLRDLRQLYTEANAAELVLLLKCQLAPVQYFQWHGQLLLSEVG